MSVKKKIFFLHGAIPNGYEESTLSKQYGIGGYSYTTITYDFAKTVLGVKTFEISETGEGMTEITGISISDKTVKIRAHTNHGHGASGWLAVVATLKK